VERISIDSSSVRIGIIKKETKKAVKAEYALTAFLNTVKLNLIGRHFYSEYH